jgi:hypothetical protein
MQTGNSKSWLACRQQLTEQIPDRYGLVLSGAANQSVRALETFWSFHFHFPVVSRARPYDGHPPISGTITQHMFNESYNLPASSGIARVLHLDPGRHVSIIVQSGQAIFLCTHNRFKTHERRDVSPATSGSRLSKNGAGDCRPRDPAPLEMVLHNSC